MVSPVAQRKQHEIFADDVIWSVPIYDRKNAVCRLVEVLREVVRTKVVRGVLSCDEEDRQGLPESSEEREGQEHPPGPSERNQP